MSEILDLAQSFEKKSKQQACAISKSAQNALSELESNLKSASEQSARSLENAITEQNKRLRRLIKEESDKSYQSALKSWLAVWIVIATTLALAMGALWWMGQEITARSQTLSDLNDRGAKMQIYNCDGKPCIAIPGSPKTYTAGDGTRLVIPKGY